VHEAGEATYKSFVGFYLTLYLLKRASLHCLANPMIQEPSALLSNTQGARGFVRADSVLAIDDLPDSGKPLVEAERRILEDGSDLYAELSPIMPDTALPAALVRKEPDSRAPTRRAVYGAIWPPHRDHKLKADIRVFEESNRV
jgi:hypothetical protein